MKRSIAYTTAALLASASLAIPAYALDVGADVGIGAGAQVGGNGGSDNSGGLGVSGNVDANTGAQVQTGGGSSDDGSIDSGTTASTDSNANFGLLISSMQSGDSNAAAIQGMSEVSSVTVVNVEDLTQGNNIQAVENAKSDNEDQITSLQAAVEANTDLTAELEEQSADSSDVIAANIAADGSVTLFVE